MDHVDRVLLYSRGLIDWLSLSEPIQQLLRAISTVYDELCAAIVIMDTKPAVTGSQMTMPQHRHRSGGGGGGGGASSNKKSWSELKSVVSDLRRSLAGLSSMVPMNVHFRTLSDGRTRIYFLSTPPNGWETTLLYADIGPASKEDESTIQQPPPK